ncbi:TLC domain-containing protein 2-like [Xenia sp. Carnegie-2017]|uniref:TLC domain-containing protein 2-like n=1 Tax=Xenia sp. Carnegie-2017 TaxID=2897299 RepID=UPI001F04B553|nr:TLC domain-containing protein 2-like [Xenia sp. Carnegie-2017]
MENLSFHVNWFKICIFSAICFILVNKYVVLLFPAPPKFIDKWKKIWLWKNILTSFIHSCLSSALAFYSLYSSPAMLKDMLYTWNSLAYCTLSLSMGYFVYDLMNLIINDLGRGLCVIIHHILVIFIFYLSVSHKKYIPFALCALLMEINSIFLHSRRLLNMTDADPDGLALKVNRILLTVTFVIFRLVACSWMVTFIVAQRHFISQLHFQFGILGMSVVIPQNMFLLKQVWTSDAKRMKQLSQTEIEKAKEQNVNNNSRLAKVKQFLQMTIDRSAE